MKEFHKPTPVFKDNFLPDKFPKTRRSSKQESLKIIDQQPKKNLPELKLVKTRIRPGSDPELDPKEKHKISNKTGLKYVPFIANMNKNYKTIKKSDLMFPRIRNAINKINRTNTNYFFDQEENINNLGLNNLNTLNINIQQNNKNNKLSSKRKAIQSRRNEKIKTLYGTYGINAKNMINNNKVNSIPNNKNSETEKSNNENSSNINSNNSHNNIYINLQKIKTKNAKYGKSNKSLPSKGTKYKKSKKELNFKDTLTIKPLILNNNLTSIKNNNLENNDNNAENKIDNNKFNLIELKKKENPLDNFISDKPSYIENKPSILESFKPTPVSLPTTNNFLETDILQRINILNSLLNPLSFFAGLNSSKTIELTPDIFKSTFKNFYPSIIPFNNEFTDQDIIKGYAYNTSMGKYRDYNEDTITATKILNDTYFFAVYDGHGGNGCSLFLKENLHKYIKSFSKEGINEAVNNVENIFLNEIALDKSGFENDHSGSCAIMALVNKNKLIIANIGDSRLVLFKKNSLFFVTEDHKPNSPKEKIRIEKAGGNIYQTQSPIPIFQNGKKIDIPWRVNPGRLSVSRTFGDIEAKNENFGGKKNIVVALPDITEIELDDDFNLLVIGCDGIFDVLSNEQIWECVRIVIKEKNIKDLSDINMSEFCGDIADMIIKSSLSLDSFDNISCIVVAFNLKDLIIDSSI